MAGAGPESKSDIALGSEKSYLLASVVWENGAEAPCAVEFQPSAPPD